jgi:hypothetical protein
MIELSEIELFKDLTLLEESGKRIFDLHNEYNCIGVTYDSNSGTINIAFEPLDKNRAGNRVCLFFEGAAITKSEYVLSNTRDSSTVSSFYRGRFEKNDELFEYSAENQGYFYLEFENGTRFEFFSKRLQLKEIKSHKGFDGPGKI